MPDYTIRDPRSGRTLTVRGDSPPTEAELDQLFSLSRGQVGRGAPGLAGGKPFSTEDFLSPKTDTGGPWGAGGRVLASAASDLNPLPLLKSVWDLGWRTGWDPVQMGAQTGMALTQAQVEQAKQAKALYDQGRVSEAIGHGAASLMPVIGPAAARAGETIGSGQTAEGIGQALALLGTLGLPKAIPRGMAKDGRMLRNPNPVEADAVSFGLREGIPVDLGTATGNSFIKAITAGAEHTPGGAMVAPGAAKRTGEALASTSERLAARAFPHKVTPDLAGQGVQGALQQRIASKSGEANRAYATLRELEASPAAERVVAQTAGGTALPGVTSAESGELRRILTELDEIQYTKRGTQETVKQGSTKEWTAGHGNAPVYRDIIGDLSPITAVKLRSAIAAGLQGYPSAWFERTLDVARRRLSGDRSLTKPLLPPGAGDGALWSSMQAPVDLAPVKAALRPVLADMEGQLAPLKGMPAGMRLEGADQVASQAVVNLRRLMELPDVAPASAVDPLLSTLKRYVAKADSPYARTRGQGVVAKAIGGLEEQLQQSLSQVPGATDALTTGRAATKAKYETLDALKAAGTKPVQVFRRLLQPGDANLPQLQTLATMEPGTLPVLGRAWLEQQFATATAEGGFKRGARLQADWQKLGPETKQLLFRDAEYVKDLDRFFLLAKNLTTEFNPSRSGLVTIATGSAAAAWMNPLSMIVSVLGGAGVAKAMHSPAFVRAIVEGMRLPVRATARRVAAVERALVAAQSAGVGVSGAVPVVAGSPSTPDTAKR